MGNGTRGFAAGFAIGANIGRNMAKDWKEAQLQEELGNASKSNQVTEQVSGEDAKANIEANFVPQEGGPQTAAEFIQQTPGVADVVAKQGTGFTTGGKSYESRDAASAAARGLNIKAMSETYARNGRPEDAARLELQGLQLKNAERQDRAGEGDESYMAARKKIAENFSFTKIQKENDAAAQKYDADTSAYQAALKANPDNPAAAGMAPQKPLMRTPTAMDKLNDFSAMIRNDAAHGRLDPAHMAQYQKMEEEIKGEIDVKALKLLHSGDMKGAIKAFEERGDLKIPEGAKVEMRKGVYEKAGMKNPTHELVVKMPDGTVQVYNALRDLETLNADDKIINNNFKGAELGLSKQRVGIAGAENSRAQARFDAEAPARDVVKTLGTAQLALANETDPDARKAIQGKINDLKTATAKTAPHVSKLIYGEDNMANMVMSDGSIKPILDGDGNPIKKGEDKKLQVSLAKVMAEGVTDEGRMRDSMGKAGDILSGKPAKEKPEGAKASAKPWEKYQQNR